MRTGEAWAESAGPEPDDLRYVTGGALERALALACEAGRWELAEQIAGVLAARAASVADVTLLPQSTTARARANGSTR